MTMPRLSKTHNLAAKYPEIAKQWHPTKNGILTALDVTPFSNKKVWWLCEKHPNEEWFVPPSARASGKGCKFCANQAVNTSNSLAAKCPNLAGQWDTKRNCQSGLTPETVAFASGHRVWWNCPVAEDHVWETDIYSRSQSGTGCPFCANKAASITNSLETLYPDIASQWHPSLNGSLTPSDFVAGSHEAIWWQCPRSIDHIFKTTIAHRAQRGQGCPQCTHQTSIPEIRIYSELLKLFDGAKSRFKIDKKEIDIFIEELSLGIEYDGSYYHADKETKDRSKNNFMLNRGISIIRVRERPLNKISTHDIIVRDHNLSKADLNRIVQSIIDIIPAQDSSKFDDYLKLNEFHNEDVFKKYLSYLPDPFPEDSLQERNSNLASQWHTVKNFPLTPRNFTEHSGKKAWWICKKNEEHEWEASIDKRSQGRGCPFCAGQKVHESNSLAKLYPNISAEWHKDLNKENRPNLVTAGSGIKVWWQCSKDTDHKWQATPHTRVKGHGCPKCGIIRRSAPKVVLREKRFETHYPHLLAEWDFDKNGDLKPNHISKSSNRKIHWICQKNANHKWVAATYSRGPLKSGCPHCHSLRRKKNIS
jgi:very-short-patch-repair endonuclease